MAETAEGRRTYTIVAVAALAVALMLSALLPARALAAVNGISDPSAKDSTITIKPVSTDNKQVGGTFSIYKVADVKTASEAGDKSGDNAYHFVWTDAYAADGKASGVDIYDQVQNLSETDRTTLATALTAKGSAYATADADASGTATFKNVQPGLYLIVQTKTADGYDVINPFVYAVTANNQTFNATPKAGQASKTKTTPSTPKTTPSTKPSTPSYTHSASAKLPQTGQLWWPVWILAVAGSAFVVAGLVTKSRSGQKSNKAEA